MSKKECFGESFPKYDYSETEFQPQFRNSFHIKTTPENDTNRHFKFLRTSCKLNYQFLKKAIIDRLLSHLNKLWTESFEVIYIYIMYRSWVPRPPKWLPPSWVFARPWPSTLYKIGQNDTSPNHILLNTRKTHSNSIQKCSRTNISDSWYLNK